MQWSCSPYNNIEQDHSRDHPAFNVVGDAKRQAHGDQKNLSFHKSTLCALELFTYNKGLGRGEANALYQSKTIRDLP